MIMEEIKSDPIIKFIQIEGIEIPAVANVDGEMYFSVKMVEGQILKHFPNIVPPKVSPLCSIPLLTRSIDLLNGVILERNLKLDFLPPGESGIKVEDFVKFYVIIKRCYPYCAEKLRNGTIQTEKGSNNCGWILINHTVVPYIVQDSWIYLPQQILLHSAKLNAPSNICNSMSETHYKLMNGLCQVMKTEITFDQNTQYIPLQFVQDFNPKIKVHELNVPYGHNPVDYAKPVLSYLKMKSDTSKPVFKESNNNETYSLPSKCDSVIKNESSNFSSSNIVHSQDSTGRSEELLPTAECLQDASVFTKVQLCGQTLTWVERDKVKYILVEIVARLFFQSINLQTFVCKVQELVNDLKECTRNEEICFCKYYGIQMKSLKYKHLIDLPSLTTILPILHERLKMKKATNFGLQASIHDVIEID